ncbi:hypothetical protein KI387_024996, partial [Taxus chinensis]
MNARTTNGEGVEGKNKEHSQAQEGEPKGFGLASGGIRDGEGETGHGGRVKPTTVRCPNPRAFKMATNLIGVGRQGRDGYKFVGGGAAGNGGSAHPHLTTSFKDALGNKGGRTQDFDLNTYSMAKTMVCIRLPNLPLHLWYALEDIGNIMGKFIKEDLDRTHS